MTPRQLKFCRFMVPFCIWGAATDAGLAYAFRQTPALVTQFLVAGAFFALGLVANGTQLVIWRRANDAETAAKRAAAVRQLRP